MRSNCKTGHTWLVLSFILPFFHYIYQYIKLNSGHKCILHAKKRRRETQKNVKNGKRKWCAIDLKIKQKIGYTEKTSLILEKKSHTSTHFSKIAFRNVFHTSESRLTFSNCGRTRIQKFYQQNNDLVSASCFCF